MGNGEWSGVGIGKANPDRARTSNLDRRLRNRERRTQNLDRRTQNLERRTRNLERRTRNLERRTWNLDRRTQNLERRIQNLVEPLEPLDYANAAPTMIRRIRIHGDPCEMLLVWVGCPLASPPVPNICQCSLPEMASRLAKKSVVIAL